MSLTTDEQTAHDGQPLELYTFTLPGGTIYRFTDHHTNYTWSANVYTAIPIERTNIRITGIAEPADITISMPYDRAIVTALAFKSPTRTATVTILRTHVSSLDGSLIWQGPIRNVVVKNWVAQFRVPRLADDILDTQIPTVSVQGICNHILYDSRCGLLASNFDVATTVSSISASDARIITVGSVGAFTNAQLVNGELVNDDDGERQMITAASGTQLTVMRPFRSLAATDAVTLYRGCDHSLATCNTDFSNAVNFGGHPYIVPSSLFRRGIGGYGS